MGRDIVNRVAGRPFGQKDESKQRSIYGMDKYSNGGLVKLMFKLGMAE